MMAPRTCRSEPFQDWDLVTVWGSGLPAATQAQASSTGHSSHLGALAVQINAPNSMVATFHVLASAVPCSVEVSGIRSLASLRSAAVKLGAAAPCAEKMRA